MEIDDGDFRSIMEDYWYCLQGYKNGIKLSEEEYKNNEKFFFDMQKKYKIK
jgi:hypothetical protein